MMMMASVFIIYLFINKKSLQNCQGSGARKLPKPFTDDKFNDWSIVY